IGVLAGVPGFLGYFFDVGFLFFAKTIDRSLASFGNWNVFSWMDSSPKALYAFLAYYNYVNTLDPINAIKVHSNLQSSKQYSARTFSFATALANTTSYFSRYNEFCPVSSALPCTKVTLVNPSRSIKRSKKRIRFCKESIMVTWISGCTINIGMLGKPAPAPISQTLLPASKVV